MTITNRLDNHELTSSSPKWCYFPTTPFIYLNKIQNFLGHFVFRTPKFIVPNLGIPLFSYIHYVMHIISYIITIQSHFPYTSYRVYVFHAMCNTQSRNHKHGTHIRTQHETHYACSGLNPSHELLGIRVPKLRYQAMTLVSISPQ